MRRYTKEDNGETMCYPSLLSVSVCVRSHLCLFPTKPDCILSLLLELASSCFPRYTSQIGNLRWSN
jgi:hypothetical protein